MGSSNVRFTGMTAASSVSKSYKLKVPLEEPNSSRSNAWLGENNVVGATDENFQYSNVSHGKDQPFLNMTIHPDVRPSHLGVKIEEKDVIYTDEVPVSQFSNSFHGDGSFLSMKPPETSSCGAAVADILKGTGKNKDFAQTNHTSSVNSHLNPSSSSLDNKSRESRKNVSPCQDSTYHNDRQTAPQASSFTQSPLQIPMSSTDIMSYFIKFEQYHRLLRQQQTKETHSLNTTKSQLNVTKPVSKSGSPQIPLNRPYLKSNPTMLDSYDSPNVQQPIPKQYPTYAKTSGQVPSSSYYYPQMPQYLHPHMYNPNVVSQQHQTNVVPNPLNQTSCLNQHFFHHNCLMHPLSAQQPFSYTTHQSLTPHVAFESTSQNQPNIKQHQAFMLHAMNRSDLYESQGPWPNERSQAVPKQENARKQDFSKHQGSLDPNDTNFFVHCAPLQAADMVKRQKSLLLAFQEKMALKKFGANQGAAERYNVAQERPKPILQLSDLHFKNSQTSSLASEKGRSHSGSQNELTYSCFSMSASSPGRVKQVFSSCDKSEKPKNCKRSFEPQTSSPVVSTSNVCYDKLLRMPSPMRLQSFEAGSSANSVQPTLQQNGQNDTTKSDCFALSATTVTFSTNSNNNINFMINNSNEKLRLSKQSHKRRKLLEKLKLLEESRKTVSNCLMKVSLLTESVAALEVLQNSQNTKIEGKTQNLIVDNKNSDVESTVFLRSNNDDSDFGIRDFIQSEMTEESFTYHDPRFDFINPELNKKCSKHLNNLQWIEQLLTEMEKNGKLKKYFKTETVKDAELTIRSYIIDTRQKQRDVETTKRLLKCVLAETTDDEPSLKKYKKKCLQAFDKKKFNVFFKSR